MIEAIAKPQPPRFAGNSCPLAEEIAWPDDIGDWLRRFEPLGGAVFFDSARRDQQFGRYSYLAAAQWQTVMSRRTRVRVSRAGEPTCELVHADPFAVLARELNRYATEPVTGLPPFQGGAAGLFSYELCHHIERLPRPRFDEFESPDLVVHFYDWVIALDHAAKRAWIVSTGLPASEGRPRRSRAEARLSEVRARIEATSAPIEGRVPSGSVLSAALLVPQRRLSGLTTVTSNFSRDDYLRAIERAIDYIRAGDVYQVNLSQRLLAPLDEPPLELYLRLRERNAAPFAAYFDAGEFVIACASPERFLRLDRGDVETRPIKGTRPRWPTPEADMLSGLELLDSDKDRAENVMIVDLLRNDLGRVCDFGSIRVADPLRLESFEFVHHLVSSVRGRLRRGCGPIDLLRAAFPGGSVTGAPKIRAMEIIAELEPTARGPYCGSLGWIGFDGSMDTNILIRTFTCGRDWVQFPVGGGIVADSSPDREYEETLHKAEGMMRALEP